LEENKTKETEVSAGKEATDKAVGRTKYNQYPAEINRIVDNMNLLDDDLMSRVFDNNNEAMECVLRIILDRADIRIVRAIGQREYKNPIVGKRTLRVDVEAEDSDSARYDMEVQRKKAGAHVRRARLHSSMLDTRMLKAGKKFQKLKDSYVIFITQTDVMGGGKSVYHLNRVVEELQCRAEDGSHIIYVNGSYRGDDPIGRLMHDFRCENPDDMYYPVLAKGVRYFKEKGGRENMCDAVEKYARKQAAESRKQGIQQSIRNLMESMKWTAEQAMDALKIPEVERSKYKL
jgi:hypothetical protein